MTAEPAAAAPAATTEPRPDEVTSLAVIDLGSNSFRLVVFTTLPEVWWRRTDEIYESVRIGAGLAESGRLGRKRMARALHTLDTYAHFCRARGLDAAQVRPVATSAIRDASNRRSSWRAAREQTGLEVRVLEAEEEARYGYLAAINSTSLDSGAVLDLGGGSLQLIEVSGRQAGALESWPLGTVRMTERFLPDEKASAKALKALRAHLREELDGAAWLDGAGRLVGIGGTVRNLAAAAQKARRPALLRGAGLLPGAHGAGGADRRAGGPAGVRARLGAGDQARARRRDPRRSGRPSQAVLEAGGFDAIEVTEAGLREGVFFEWYLDGLDPPLLGSVREASVYNLHGHYETDPTHVEHVAHLALAMFDDLAAAGLHPGDRAERELLWAAAILHDIGMTVDYDDHHRHSRYLVLNAGLPGFSPREVALIAQAVRYHRKGSPSLGEFAPLCGKGDEARLARMSALLRVAEQLERSRDQSVREVRLDVDDNRVRLELVAGDDAAVARWGAERQADVFAAAFQRRLEIAA